MNRLLNDQLKAEKARNAELEKQRNEFHEESVMGREEIADLENRNKELEEKLNKKP